MKEFSAYIPEKRESVDLHWFSENPYVPGRCVYCTEYKEFGPHKSEPRGTFGLSSR